MSCLRWNVRVVARTADGGRREERRRREVGACLSLEEREGRERRRWMDIVGSREKVKRRRKRERRAQGRQREGGGREGRRCWRREGSRERRRER